MGFWSTPPRSAPTRRPRNRPLRGGLGLVPMGKRCLRLELPLEPSPSGSPSVSWRSKDKVTGETVLVDGWPGFDKRSLRWKDVKGVKGSGTEVSVQTGCPRGYWETDQDVTLKTTDPATGAGRVVKGRCRVGLRAHMTVKPEESSGCPMGYVKWIPGYKGPT